MATNVKNRSVRVLKTCRKGTGNGSKGGRLPAVTRLCLLSIIPGGAWIEDDDGIASRACDCISSGGMVAGGVCNRNSWKINQYNQISLRHRIDDSKNLS